MLLEWFMVLMTTGGQRLRRSNITTLATRRLGGDLIEVFNIVKGFDDVDYLDFFHLSAAGLSYHT